MSTFLRNIFNPPLTDSELARFRRTLNPKEIRRRLHMTQEQFAAGFQLPLGTLRDWKQGVRQPDSAAKSYLRVIAKNPQAILDALAGSRTVVYMNNPGIFEDSGIVHANIWPTLAGLRHHSITCSALEPRIARKPQIVQGRNLSALQKIRGSAVTQRRSNFPVSGFHNA